MKKFAIPLLATTVLAGGVALAAAAPKHDGHGMPGREDMQRHRTEMCSNLYARAVGGMAFLETKLSLTPAQTGAFNAWKGVKLAEAKEHSAKCNTMGTAERDRMPSPMDRMTREEERLKGRLASLQAERPMLATFYNSLNDTQKHEFAMAAMRARGGFGGGMHGGMHRGWFGHGHGMMGHHDGMGPGGPGMDPDGDAPPPSEGQ
jgi:hypothetical protein